MINCSNNLFISETSLTRLAHQGHIAAFSTLFDLHKATVYSLCLRSTESMSEAEEMLQQIFVDAFRAVAGSSSTAAFSELLYRVADNRIQMYERKLHLAGPFLDHLVELAGEPVGDCRPTPRFGGMLARWRSARARLSSQQA